MRKIFATAISCIDGRVQKPVIEFMLKKFKADYVDMITEPGPDKVLSEDKVPHIIESIKRRVMISVEKHGPGIVVIAGHHDCAVNPVGEEEHRRQIGEAVKKVKTWGLDADIHGVWVNEKWEAVLL